MREAEGRRTLAGYYYRLMPRLVDRLLDLVFDPLISLEDRLRGEARGGRRRERRRLMIYSIEEIGGGEGTERGVRVLFHDGQTVAELRGGNASVIALTFENLRRQDERRADDYMAGVVAGLCHMIIRSNGLA